VNLGASLAKYGRRVLIIDLDPQGAASVALGINAYEQDYTIYDLMMDASLDPRLAIVPTSTKDLEIIPANIDLSAAEISLVSEVGREAALKRVTDKLKKDYDVILIDCQPTLGLLAINALTAADGVIIPLAAEYFALRGLKLLMQTIEKVQQRLNPKLTIDGIVVTMYVSATKHSQEVVETLKGGFKNEVLETLIKRTVKFPDSTVIAKTMLEFDPNHKAAKSYLQLAREVIQKNIIP